MRHWHITGWLALSLFPLGMPDARAEEVAGTILSIDPFNGRFLLTDGSRFILSGKTRREDLTIGMRVLVTYTTTEAGDHLVTGLEISG